MPDSYGRLLLSLVFVFLFAFSHAQQNSPYSRFGIGDIHQGSFSATKGMGHLNAAFRNPFNINFSNPATYSSLVLTTFETGVFFNNSLLELPDSTYKTGFASLDHFAIGFPIVKKLDDDGKTVKHGAGGSLGLVPFSRMSYNFSEQATHPDAGAYSNQLFGSGGLYHVYGGSGYNYKSFSIGVNLGYLFGKLGHSSLSFFPDTLVAFNSRRTTDLKMGDFYWNAGIQYNKTFYDKTDEKNPKERFTLTLGVYGTAGSQVRTDREELWERFRLNSDGRVIVADTVFHQNTTKGSSSFPAIVGAGIGFNVQGKWLIGTDFRYEGWSAYENGFINETLNDAWSIAAGAQYTPQTKQDATFFQRVQYKAGLYYRSTGIEINNTPLEQYGMTFGFGLPVRRRVSQNLTVNQRINIAFDIGTRGTSENNLINETYINAYLGFTFNDLWFIKRKFD